MTRHRISGRKAGHRRWAAKNGRIPGGHRGDIMDSDTRSRIMARIQGKDTSPELIINSLLRKTRLRFERHCTDLPGRPDFVFRRLRVAIFVDGSFWHGWRFPLWEHKLSPAWRSKIAETRKRDSRNFRQLRREGWTVVRLWEHEIETSPSKCLTKVRHKLGVARLQQAGLAVVDRQGAARFITACVATIGLGFHPDTPFEDYVDDNSRRVFSASDARRLNLALSSAIELCDSYETGFQEQRRLLGLGDVSI